jgi:uncharacterized lipoprotein YmbA
METTSLTGNQDRLVGLGPILLPEYLKRPQIVTRTQSAELKLAEFDRWAEPLENAFLRTIVTNVDALLESAVVVSFAYGNPRRLDLRVFGRITRFDVDESGVAVLKVQWGVRTPEGETVVPVRRSMYTVQATDREDYDSLVTALNETVEAFSRELADSLRAAMAT